MEPISSGFMDGRQLMETKMDEVCQAVLQGADNDNLKQVGSSCRSGTTGPHPVPSHCRTSPVQDLDLPGFLSRELSPDGPRVEGPKSKPGFRTFIFIQTLHGR